jgi:hypothetical protein
MATSLILTAAGLQVRDLIFCAALSRIENPENQREEKVVLKQNIFSKIFIIVFSIVRATH